MHAVFSRVISSSVLITRACCISCWPSSTVMPSACSASSTGSSMTSTPIGSLCRPRCSSSMRILRATSCACPISGPIAPRSVEMPGARPLAEPGAVELVMAGRRAEVPEDRLVVLRQQREAASLSMRPRADVRRRDVADVVHVEAEQRADLRLGEQALDAREPLRAQPLEVDALFPVDGGQAEGLESHLRSLLRQVGRASARPRRRVAAVGTVRSSSGGENGTGTSIAPSRVTGASR